MSELKVEVVEVLSVEKHPNADRLDILTCLGWSIISQKDSFKVGDLGVYFPIDSILPAEIEAMIFPPESKVKLEKSRVRTIKLRGACSQGLLIRPEVIGLPSRIKEGDDLTALLGVTKFEPPEDRIPTGMQVKKDKKKKDNPNFPKYTDIDHLKKYYNVLQEGEEVYISEKVHGTSFRAGIVKNVPRTWFDKLKNFFLLFPEYEEVWGSRQVQIQVKGAHNGFYKEDYYTKTVKEYEIFNKIEPNIIVFGEIYGCSIQSGYTYGCVNSETKLVLYDVMKDGKYLDSYEFMEYCDTRNLPRVPCLYVGPFDLEKTKGLTKGESVLCPAQKVREGVVVKPIKERIGYCGRVVLKSVSEEYLMKEQTDFH